MHHQSVGLDERQVGILATIVDAYDAQDPARRRRLLHNSSFSGFSGLEEAPDTPITKDDLDDLDDEGFVDIDYGSSGHYMVKPTSEGRDAIRALRREERRQSRAERVDLSWSAVRPVLHAIVDIWTASGASSAGYLALRHVAEELEREPDDLGLIRAVELLGEDDWIDVQYSEDDNDPLLKPTIRAVVATKEWPGGDSEVAAERLLSVLDDIAANSPDEGKRKWAVRLKETAMEVGTKTLAEVVSKAAGTAI